MQSFAKGHCGWRRSEIASKRPGGLTSRFSCHKPIIAAVNGQAIGGGFEIVLACDIVVADDTATFSLPEGRVRLAPLQGGIHRLTRKIGLREQMPLILTGRHARQSADEVAECSPRRFAPSRASS
jgi:enoyl-CoA hydratase/carnithine racemase